MKIVVSPCISLKQEDREEAKEPRIVIVKETTIIVPLVR